MLTINVIFTPGTVGLLVPFAMSLRRGSGVRVRLVANGCAAEERELLAGAAGSSEGLLWHPLPWRHVSKHGAALNYLFERFPEPLFAFADSDVLASGDFAHDLLPIPEGHCCSFSAPPVWQEREEWLEQPSLRFMTGRTSTLRNGATVPTSYFAIYDRAGIEPTWRELRHGFRLSRRRWLGSELRAEFDRRGWDYAMFDTGKVLALALLIQGERFRFAESEHLHHVGGVSIERLAAYPHVPRNPFRVLRAGPAGARRYLEHVEVQRVLEKLRRHPLLKPGLERRAIVLAHVADVLDALAAGEPIPATPTTGSDEVDPQLQRLVEALESVYPVAATAG